MGVAHESGTWAWHVMSANFRKKILLVWEWFRIPFVNRLLLLYCRGGRKLAQRYTPSDLTIQPIGTFEALYLNHVPTSVCLEPL